MKDYLLLLLAALLLALDFALNKLYQRHAGTSLVAGFGFNAMVGIFTAVLCFAMNGFVFRATPYSLLMAAAMSALMMSYILVGFRILKAGSMALYTLFLMTGGMVVPYLWGVLFLDEPFSLMRTLGLALIIFAVALSNVGGEKNKPTKLLLCVAVFVLNGFIGVISKLHQIEAVAEHVSAIEFVMLAGIFKFVLSGLAFAVLRTRSRGTGTKFRLPVGKVLPIFLASALAGGLAYVFQLMGASNLPASVLYPFLTGGTMVFSTLMGIVAFREKVSKPLWIGVGLCFVGTLLFL